jgi:hypothetical protein
MQLNIELNQISPSPSSHMNKKISFSQSNHFYQIKKTELMNLKCKEKMNISVSISSNQIGKLKNTNTCILRCFLDARVVPKSLKLFKCCSSTVSTIFFFLLFVFVHGTRYSFFVFA